MKKSVSRISLLMSLSSLLVACNGGDGSAGNHADRVEEKTHLIPSSTPLKNLITNTDTHLRETSKGNSPTPTFQSPLKQEYLTWTGYRISEWGNASNHVNKENVTVFTFIKYNFQYNDVLVFDKTKSKTISLIDDKNENKEDYYNITLKNILFNYGKTLTDYKKREENYIYTIRPDAINNENFNALPTNHYKENGFLYFILADANRICSNYILQPSNVTLTIQNGKIRSEIYRHNRGHDDMVLSHNPIYFITL